MPGLSYFRHKLFEFQAFHNHAHIINFTGIIIYFCGTYYLYASVSWVLSKIINKSNFSTMFVPPILRGSPLQAQLHASVVRMHAMNEWRYAEGTVAGLPQASGPITPWRCRFGISTEHSRTGVFRLPPSARPPQLRQRAKPQPSVFRCFFWSRF